MDNRLDVLERNMEALRKTIEEREERTNQQMEEMRAMFTSFMTRRNEEQDETQFERSGARESGIQSKLHDEKSVHEMEVRELEEEKKWWVRRKVELPNFDGSDPNGWLARAERFFEIHEVRPELKVDMAFVSMEGPAVHWFQCIRLRWPDLNWEKLRSELIKRYCGRRSGNIYEQMASLKQMGTVEEYIQEYEKVAAQFSSMPEDQRLGYFMNGLQGEIKRRIRIHEPGDLSRAMQLALDIEDEIVEAQGEGSLIRPSASFLSSGLKGGGSVGGFGAGRFKDEFGSGKSHLSSGPKRAQPVIPSKGVSAGGASVSGHYSSTYQSPAKSSISSTNREVKQLPYAEYLKRKEEGRCFRCGLKFGPLHKCPQRQLQVLILAEESETKDESELVMVETGKEEELNECEMLELGGEEQELMLQIVRGMAEPNTLKIRGNIAGLPVLALIDSGASHNFLSEDVANKLGMKGEEENSFWVRLGDGRRRQTAGLCKSVTLNLEGVKLLADFHIFPLGGVDVILGVSWLKTLGNVNLNWDTLSMEFNYGGQNVIVKGEQNRDVIFHPGDLQYSWSEMGFWGLILGSTQFQHQLTENKDTYEESKASEL